MPYQPNPDELGALWLRSGAKGEYMTGTVAGVQVVCFRAKQTSEKSPTWRVLKSKPRDEAPRRDTPLRWKSQADDEVGF